MTPEITSTFLSLKELKEFEKNLEPLKSYFLSIIEGTVGLIVGAAKTGKTTFCESLCCHLAAGRESFLDIPLSNSGNIKIALALLEEPLRLRVKRHLKIVNSFTDEEQQKIAENLYYLGEYDGFLSAKDKWDTFVSEVEKLKPDLLVIDSLTRLNEQGLKESFESNKTMKKIRRLSEKLNVTILVIHHTTKSKEEVFTHINNIKGSTEVIQEADYALAIANIKGSKQFGTVASRYMPLDEKIWIRINENNVFELDPRKNPISSNFGDKRINDKNALKILALIKELGIKEKVEFEISIIEELTDLPTSTFKDQIRKLIKNQFLEEVDKGIYKVKKYIK